MHESLILVLAASFMGGAIGVVIAIAFTSQQALFTQVCLRCMCAGCVIGFLTVLCSYVSADAGAIRHALVSDCDRCDCVSTAISCRTSSSISVHAHHKTVAKHFLIVFNSIGCDDL